jgi:hypothetical protein
MPVSASKLSLSKLSQVSAAFGAGVERNWHLDIAFERLPPSIARALPTGTVFESLALSGHVRGRETAPAGVAVDVPGTGHSLRDVEEILKAHYLGGQSELADQAIAKYGAAYGG